MSLPRTLLARSAWGALLLGSFAACTPPRQPLGAGCLFSSDCVAPNICAGRLCRAPCRTDRDCNNGYRCEPSGTLGVRVCLPPGEPGYCSYASECCSEGTCSQLCLEGRCRQQCATDLTCQQRFPWATYVCRVPPGLCEYVPPQGPDGGADASPEASPTDARPFDVFDAADAAPEPPATDAAPDALDAAVGPEASPADAAPDRAEAGADAGLDAPDAADVVETGTDASSGEPAGPPPPIVARICAGAAHTCALSIDGEVWCWGDNSVEQLGQVGPSGSDAGPIVAMSARPLRLLAGLRGAIDVQCGGGPPLPGSAPPTGGNGHACVRFADGSARCWGANNQGQLGQPIAMPGYSWNPLSVGVSEPVTSMALGAYHSCVSTSSGRVFCTGNRRQGQLGLGTESIDFTDSNQVFAFTAVRVPEPMREVFPGDYATCATAVSGRNYCWGAAASRQASPGLVTTGSLTLPLQVLPDVFPAGTTVRRFTIGLDHGCALLDNGEAWCWGNNTSGQLGNGSVGSGMTSVVTTPTRVELSTGVPLAGITALEASNYHTCAIAARDVYCWGSNGSGQLGRGTTSTANPVPVAVTGLTDAVQLALGQNHSCALRADGEVFCWGYNFSQQLGTRRAGAVDSQAERVLF